MFPEISEDGGGAPDCFFKHNVQVFVSVFFLMFFGLFFFFRLDFRFF